MFTQHTNTIQRYESKELITDRIREMQEYAMVLNNICMFLYCCISSSFSTTLAVDILCHFITIV